MTFSTAIAAAAAPVTGTTTPVPETAASLIRAARFLLPQLERGQAIDARALRGAMEEAFAGSDADGAWSWKSAYDACEAAQVLFLRKFGPAIRTRAPMPAARLAMLERLAALTPSQTRRSEESQALQQFSTPIALGFVAASLPHSRQPTLCWSPRRGPGCSRFSRRWKAHRWPSTNLPIPAPDCSTGFSPASPSRVSTPPTSTIIWMRGSGRASC